MNLSQVAIARFWSRVDSSAGPDACWPWTGAFNTHNGRKQYGNVGFQGKYHKAHRVAYTLSVGEIPAGKMILHRCDHPPCCNPAHLYVGTQFENMRDREVSGHGRHTAGETHHKAKVTDQDVRDIRRLHLEGMMGVDIAPLYGITPTQVSYIIRRKSWSHIP